MQSKQLDEAKGELLARAAEVAGTNQPPGRTAPGGLSAGAAEDLLRRYYRHTAPEDLLGRDPVDLFGAAASHCALAADRPQGTARVRVHNPSVAEHGWTSSHTVVEIVTDDMPFLVDSVSNELSRQQRGIHLAIHPQMVVRRDVAGALRELVALPDGRAAATVGAGQLPQDACLESWMHIEIDRETDPEQLAAIAGGLRRVLSDVREAVEDWTKMRQRALDIAESLGEVPPPGLPKEEVEEARELLRWLADDHFTFLGYREYDLVRLPDEEAEKAEDGDDELLRAVPATGLGILRADKPMNLPVSAAFSRMSRQARLKAREKRLLVLTKANSRATVHRPAYLDYVGVKKFDEHGNVVGERRFLGLLSSTAYTESVRRVPVVRRRVAEVLERAGFPPNSHDGRDLLQILETYPRDELFQTHVDELLAITTSVLYLQERRRLRLFLRKDDYGRFFSALVYLPRDRYTTQVRERITAILKEELGGVSVDYTARNTESVLSRLHYIVRTAPGTELGDPDVERIEARLSEATRSWSDGFVEALHAEFGEERAARLAREWSAAFPEGYKADFPPRAAVADLRHITALGPADFTLNLYQPVGAPPGTRRFKIYRTGGPISLTTVLPVLQRLGVEVVDEHPYELRRRHPSTPPAEAVLPAVTGETGAGEAATAAEVAWIYDFGLRLTHTDADLTPDARERFQEAFAAVWRGEAESDGFNELVLRAGLTWRQAMVLRAYAKYLRQAGSTFSQDYIEDALVHNVHAARLLVNLFEARFSPKHQKAGSELTDGILEELDWALEQVASLDEDRILRSFLAMIKATLRTNFFTTEEDGSPRGYVSMKFDPRALPDLPAPRPAFEIWVYSPRVEGVHLRFGKVARGGLRWSDRREDFRTEILGLVKAQMVKNTVIVPVGAKGGFVAKRLPDPAVDRDAWLAEGVACYTTFIRGLLDITDNLVTGDGGEQTVVPPRDVVRHDGDDTYLVVAADKGTATFSDIANKVAADYGFWLGDAFASGGSAGYDHKGMGITARGAWESVRRHFRELGHDTQTQDFTVVGIGDMSGDVFGNGMLLSEHIRLVAAFDHRHIFLDPDPEPITSYAERRRLFQLPRSSWADYDTALLSPGGGVHPRSAKSIAITPQVRRALGLDAAVSRMTPAELMRAILLAPVDLLWNGGIGTYVKASTETDADVGDRANDAIRVDGRDLRARVVGEGGNLGLTQLGRVEYAQSGCGGSGGRINTDAIDNSAGVDTSDHEVNIKILLNQVVADGDLTVKQRNELLAGMTDEVARLVLANNYAQNAALASSVNQAPALLHAHQRYIKRLVREGRLDRQLEFLPTDRQIRERLQAGAGLTQPELAVLLAYTKITAAEELLETSLPDDPYLRGALHDYFPTPLRERFADRIDAHPLRREIITTVLVNEMVNTGGITFTFRLREETGASWEEIARAHTAARRIFDIDGLREEVERLDNEVPAEVQTGMRLHGRRLAERSTRWLLNNRRQPLDIADSIAFFAARTAEVLTHLPKLLRGVDLEWYQRVAGELSEAGVPDALADRVAGLSCAFPALDIVDVADRTGRDVVEVAEVYYDLADRLDIAQLLQRITGLPRTDRWKSMARLALREDLYAAHAELTREVLAQGTGQASPEERFRSWQQDSPLVARARTTLEEIGSVESYDLATLSVALRMIRTLLRSDSVR
ncbi:NAD-glutamate dehydrogenase [Allostreptomyces psammosilenae]|uniref:Glutamate dehydrogenase n=1 Tax=Allostreptomyces psammosilenae TaxID=1892865 RepID=A0A853A6U8_9ACTN|nr:NAD-glutamate dehydrogenase [Allostreptomyces psammosilenae]NYI06192.1 glutamate dehydrogenase [Allostreptomyces psammosilenae]